MLLVKSQSKHNFLFFLFLLKHFTLLIVSLHASTDIGELSDPHNSDLLVSHYDGSKQHNLFQFSLTPVQTCAQEPSSSDSTRDIANVVFLAKYERLKAWTFELMCNLSVCAQSD